MNKLLIALFMTCMIAGTFAADKYYVYDTGATYAVDAKCITTDKDGTTEAKAIICKDIAEIIKTPAAADVFKIKLLTALTVPAGGLTLATAQSYSFYQTTANSLAIDTNGLSVTVQTNVYFNSIKLTNAGTVTVPLFIHGAAGTLHLNGCKIDAIDKAFVIFQSPGLASPTGVGVAPLQTGSLFLNGVDFKVKAAPGGNIQMNQASASTDAAAQINIMGGAFTIAQGAGVSDPFIKLNAAATNGAIKTVVIYSDATGPATFTGVASPAYSAPIVSTDGVVPHLVQIKNIVVKSLLVQSPIFFIQKANLLLNGGNFESNENKAALDITTTGFAHFGTVFSIYNSYFQILANTTAIPVTFTSNKGFLGPAIAIKINAALPTKNAAITADPSNATPVSAYTAATFTHNSAAHEGGAIFVTINAEQSAADVANYYTKFYTVTNGVPTFANLVFTGNSAYTAEFTSPQTTPYQGDGAKFGVFFFVESKKNPSFRFIPVSGSTGKVDFVNNVPHIVGINSKEAIAQRLTFTYGDIFGNPYGDYADTNYRGVAAAAPTQVGFRPSSDANSTKQSVYDFSTSTSGSITNAASVANATVETLLTTVVGSNATKASFENDALYKTTFKKTVSSGCGSHSGRQQLQAIYGTSAGSEYELKSGPSVDTTDSYWYFIVDFGVASMANFTAATGNLVRPANVLGTAEGNFLIVPVLFKDPTCLNTCKLNEYVNANSVCTKCDATCKTCTGGSASECTLCFAGQAPYLGVCACSDKTQVIGKDGVCTAPTDALATEISNMKFEGDITQYLKDVSYVAAYIQATQGSDKFASTNWPCGPESTCFNSGKCTKGVGCNCTATGMGALCQYNATTLTLYQKAVTTAVSKLSTLFTTLASASAYINAATAVSGLISAPDAVTDDALKTINAFITGKLVIEKLDTSAKQSVQAVLERAVALNAAINRYTGAAEARKTELAALVAAQEILSKRLIADNYALLKANRGKPVFFYGENQNQAALAFEAAPTAAQEITTGTSTVKFPLSILKGFSNDTTAPPVVAKVVAFTDNIYAAAAPQTLVSTGVVQIELFTGDTGTEAKSLTNAAEPIQVTITINNASVSAGNLTCAFWNTATSSWDTTGVTKSNATQPSGSIICQTTHLTAFAGVLGSTNSTNPSTNNSNDTNGTNGIILGSNNYMYLYALLVLGFIAALL